MKKYAFFSVLLLLFSFSAVFGKDLTWSTHVFPDGFTLVTKEVHNYPSASVHLFVRAGSVNETPEKNGISHLYEHMFFKGTKKRSATEMKTDMEDYGGDINGATYRDYTEFMVDIPAIYVDQAVDFLMDGFLNATLEPQGLDQERKVVLDEVGLDAANPERQLSDLFQRNMYSVHPYRLPIAGSVDSVKSVTREELEKWKETYYVPSNSVMVVVGDINTEKVIDQLQDILKDVKSAPFSPPAYPPEPPKTHPIIEEQTQSVDRAFLLIGYMVGSLEEPADIYPTDVLTFMLGYGRSSLLTRLLKDKDHLVEEVSADFLTEPLPGTLQIEAVAKPKSVEDCKKEILSLLDQIKKGKIDPGEVERAKVLLDGVYTLGNQTDNGMASTIGFYVAMGNGDFARSYLAHIHQVTLQDIVRIANKYLDDNYVEAVFLPSRSSEK